GAQCYNRGIGSRKGRGTLPLDQTREAGVGTGAISGASWILHSPGIDLHTHGGEVVVGQQGDTKRAIGVYGSTIKYRLPDGGGGKGARGLLRRFRRSSRSPLRARTTGSDWPRKRRRNANHALVLRLNGRSDLQS